MSDIKNIVKAVRYDLGSILKYMDHISDDLKRINARIQEMNFNLDEFDRYVQASDDFLPFPEVEKDEEI